MASFKDLGLREPLLRALEDAGIDQPTAIQEEVIPVLRREGNLVARASTGAGKTLAYALGVFDRVRPVEASGEGEDDEASGVRVLVLVATTEVAERTAVALVPFAQAVEMGISVAGGSWGTPLSQGQVVIGTPADLLAAVRASGVKLDALEAVVIDGASDVQTLGGWEAVETLMDHVPRDAQRVVVSAALTPEVEDLIDRRVKRALRWPPQPADPASMEVEPMQGTVGYALVSERERLEVIARFLTHSRDREHPPVLFSRSDERAAELAEALSLRGFLVGETDDADADVAVVAAGTTRAELAEESGEDPGQTISYDVPPDERTLLARHGGDEGALVLLEPRELPHLRLIADRARLGLQAVAPPTPESAAAELEAFREQLRRALREEDLGANMLVLEPLFEEFGPAEVAAAAAALLRRRPAAAAQGTASAGAAPERTAAPERPSAGAPGAAYTRLYVGIGSRDGIRPGDLVGAIAGEAGIQGTQVGKIEIRDTFSIVEVHAGVAERVIQSLNGTTMKGRSLRVDYDRAGDRMRKRGPGGGPGAPSGPGPRRTVRRPPTRG